MNCEICNNNNHFVFATNILDGAESKIVPQPKGLDVVKCDGCGLFSFSPQPTPEQLLDYHSKDYFIATSRDTQIGYENYIEESHLDVKVAWGKRMIEFLYLADNKSRKWWQRARRHIKVLDVGCATGFTTLGMSKYEKCVVTAVGVDISEWAIRYGRAKMPDLPLYCGRLPEIDLSKYAPFDYIVFWDSLEHECFLRSTINSASNLLRKNGLILIQTPDGKCAKPDWYYWSPHQHSHVFTIDNLGQLLSQYNIHIIEDRLSIEPDELMVIARKGR